MAWVWYEFDESPRGINLDFVSHLGLTDVDGETRISVVFNGDDNRTLLKPDGGYLNTYLAIRKATGWEIEL